MYGANAKLANLYLPLYSLQLAATKIKWVRELSAMVSTKTNWTRTFDFGLGDSEIEFGGLSRRPLEEILSY